MILIYCIDIWGISAQSHLRPLLLSQKKIVRIMTFSTYYAHTDPLFKDLKADQFDSCRNFCILYETSYFMNK